MAKQLPAYFFAYTAEYEFKEYACTLPPGLTITDLFNPVAWANHARKFAPGDRIRVRTNDGSIDVMLVVDAVSVGGVHVSEWPKFLGASGGAALADLSAEAKRATPTVVPFDTDGEPKVRVQYLPATQWRVLGLNGEIARDLGSEAAAIDKMHEYLKQAGLTMPEAAKEADAETSEPSEIQTETTASPPRKPAKKAANKDAA